MTDKKYTLGIDIGSTTVKVAVLSPDSLPITSAILQTFRKPLPTCSGKHTKSWAN